MDGPPEEDGEIEAGDAPFLFLGLPSSINTLVEADITIASGDGRFFSLIHSSIVMEFVRSLEYATERTLRCLLFCPSPPFFLIDPSLLLVDGRKEGLMSEYASSNEFRFLGAVLALCLSCNSMSLSYASCFIMKRRGSGFESKAVLSKEKKLLFPEEEVEEK